VNAIRKSVAVLPPYLEVDAALYLYIGLRFADGDVPYKHVWEIKPPAMAETTGILAIATGGDPLVYWTAVTVVLVAVALATVTLLSVLVYHWTGNRLAAFTAGLTPLAFPTWYLSLATGPRPKYFMLLFGAAAIYCYVRDYPTWSMVCGALAAAYWQFGIIFPAGVLIGYWQGGSRHSRIWLRLGGGLLASTIVVLAPFVYADALPQTIGQTVLTVFMQSPSQPTLTKRLGYFRHLVQFAWIVPVVGTYGGVVIVQQLRSGAASRGLWWMPVTIAWFDIQFLVFDLDGLHDLLPIMTVGAFGVGVAVNHIDTRTQHTFLVPAVVAAAIFMGTPWVLNPETVSAGGSDLAEQIWSQNIEPQCHVRVTGVQERWMEVTGAPADERVCSGVRSYADLIELADRIS
jgi:hypothetical protein